MLVAALPRGEAGGHVYGPGCPGPGEIEPQEPEPQKPQKPQAEHHTHGLPMLKLDVDTIHAASSTYRSKGVAKIAAVFSQDEVNQIRKAALHVLTQVPEINNAGYRHKPLEVVRDEQGNPSPALIFWPCLANAAMNAARVDARLLQVVTSLLGPDVKQLNNQFYYRLPGDSDSFAWHQDIMFRHPLDNYPRIVEEDGYLQTAIVIDEMHANNAPIIFIEGSNHFGDLGLHAPGDYSGLRGFDPERLPASIKQLQQVEMYAQPGDLLLWSSLTVHGSRANKSTTPRMYYMNGFARASNSHVWPNYAKNGQVSLLDPALLP